MRQFLFYIYKLYLDTTGFLLYYLTYIGDSPVSCPAGMFSATGNYPGCKCKFLYFLNTNLSFTDKK